MSSRQMSTGKVSQLLCKLVAICCLALLESIPAMAGIVHEYDVGGAGNLHTLWADGVGSRDLSAATGVGGSTKVVFSDDSRVSISRAYTATEANLNSGAGTGLPSASYTFEFWIHFGGAVSAGEVIFETGGAANGIGLFTRAGGLEFATSSVVTGADAIATVVLTGLDLNHYIQVVAVFDTAASGITLIAKDVGGAEVVHSSLSDHSLLTGTSNGIGLFSGSNGNFGRARNDIGGSGATGVSLPGNPGVFSGKIGLVRIYDGVDLDSPAAAFSAIVLPASRATDPRPNFIVIYTDDQGYADVAVQGVDPDVWTPQIDRLATEGVRFTNGYITAPQCVPSRAGLISGQYQQRFGVDQNSLGPLETSILTIPERLRKAGYRTGMVGKWHLEPRTGTSIEWADKMGIDVQDIPESMVRRYFPDQHGFEEFAAGDLLSMVNPPVCCAWRNFNHDGSKNDPLGTSELPRRPGVSRIDIKSEYAESFIDRNHNRPFFLFVSYYAPHTPLTWVPRHREAFDLGLPEARRMVLGMIKAIDDGVGRILAKLIQYGIDENTIIWFISDNGGYPGNSSSNKPWVGEKGMLTEGGIRVPWLMRWKGSLAPKVYQHPVISLDVGATAVALAGLADDSSLDGVNLIPYLTAKIPDAPHEYLYWRFWNQSAIRNGRWKYLKQAWNDAQAYLFDLTSDKHEKVNLIDQFPDIATELDNRLESWKAGLHRPGDLAGNRSPDFREMAEIDWYRHHFSIAIDTDGDGTVDSHDAFPLDPVASVDTDGDGMPDDFNAGAAPDAILNSDLIVDLDDDNDGMNDVDELAANRNPLINESILIQIINFVLTDE